MKQRLNKLYFYFKKISKICANIFIPYSIIGIGIGFIQINVYDCFCNYKPSVADINLIQLESRVQITGNILGISYTPISLIIILIGILCAVYMKDIYKWLKVW